MKYTCGGGDRAPETLQYENREANTDSGHISVKAPDLADAYAVEFERCADMVSMKILKQSVRLIDRLLCE